MQYALCLREIKIGIVTENDCDFPNLMGTIIFDESLTQLSSGEGKRLARFLELNKESSRLVGIEHEQDVSIELATVNKQLEDYIDYIDTQDWILITDNGKELPILCPIFHTNGEIVWRWDIREASNKAKA